MYVEAYLRLNLHTVLQPYYDGKVQGFHRRIRRLLGYMKLLVDFGTDYNMLLIRIQFMIVCCDSIYNFILGRPSLATLGKFTSTVHLKIKFNHLEDQIVVLEANLPSLQACFLDLNAKTMDVGESQVVDEEHDKTLQLDLWAEETFPNEIGEDNKITPSKSPQKWRDPNRSMILLPST